MRSANQTPEQEARDKIDAMLGQAGWKVQSKKRIDLGAGLGIAVREYQTDIGPADYVLFVDKKPVGVVEAKPENWGHNITAVEEQSGSYASANDPRVLVGLEKAVRVEAVRVYWPDGQTEEWKEVPINAYSKLVQGGGTRLFLPPERR